MASSCDHHASDLATDLDHLVVIIRGMTPGIWVVDFDHLVVIMMT